MKHRLGIFKERHETEDNKGRKGGREGASKGGRGLWGTGSIYKKKIRLRNDSMSPRLQQWCVYVFMTSKCRRQWKTGVGKEGMEK